MLTSEQLKKIRTEARPLIEEQMAIATKLAAFRDMVSGNGGDWAALKAIIKAEIQDEQDEGGEANKIGKVCDKAEFTLAYAEMLGLNMNEENFVPDAVGNDDAITHSAEPPPPVPAEPPEGSDDSRASGEPIPADDAEPVPATTNGGSDENAVPVKEDVSDRRRPEPSEAEAWSQGPDTTETNTTPAGSVADEIPAPIPEFRTAVQQTMDRVLERRPHCLHPDKCVTSNPREHCWGCRKQHAEEQGFSA